MNLACATHAPWWVFVLIGVWIAFVLWMLLRDPTWNKETKRREPR